MARYIDADDLKAVIYANDWSNPVVPDVVGVIIDRSPTADVAPREEVAIEIFEKIRNILNKHYYACYQNEDGDECDAVISYLSYVAVDFDRLEQKYTGAEPEPPKGDHHE